MKLNTTAIKFEEEIESYDKKAIIAKEGDNLKFERIKSRLSIMYFAVLLLSLIVLLSK